MNFLFFQLPLLASTSGDILEVFLVKHSLVCNQLGRFSFSSKTFRPEEKNRRNLSPTSGQGPGFGQAINEVVSCARRIHVDLPHCCSKRQIHSSKICRSKFIAANCGIIISKNPGFSAYFGQIRD